MKRGTIKNVVLSLAAMVLMTTGAVGGGPAPQEQESAPEAASPTEVHAESCGDWGYFTCPDNGRSYYYEACAGTSLRQDVVQNRCEQACVATCVDSGWNPN